MQGIINVDMMDPEEKNAIWLLKFTTIKKIESNLRFSMNLTIFTISRSKQFRFELHIEVH